MPTEAAILFAPFRLDLLDLCNRIVTAPRTLDFNQDCLPGAAHVGYYRKRAEGEAGLILSEGAVIERSAARNKPGISFFHGSAQEGWRKVIEALHTSGGRMAPQLWHVASIESNTTSWQPSSSPESPSGFTASGEAAA